MVIFKQGVEEGRAKARTENQKEFENYKIEVFHKILELGASIEDARKIAGITEKLAKAEAEKHLKNQNKSELFNAFDDAFPDGRLTEYSTTKYRLRDAIAYKESVGRTLTKEEMQQFVLKEEK